MTRINIDANITADFLLPFLANAPGESDIECKRSYIQFVMRECINRLPNEISSHPDCAAELEKYISEFLYDDWHPNNLITYPLKTERPLALFLYPAYKSN